LALGKADPADGSPNDYRPVLSLLAAGSGPADMALFDTSDGTRLLVVAPGSRDAFVVDARSARTTRLPLDAAATRIYGFTGASPGDTKTQPRALLLGAGLGTRTASFLDLERVDDLRTRNLDTRPIGEPAVDAVALTGEILIAHRGQQGGAAFSVIDLQR